MKDTNVALIVTGMLLATGAWEWADEPHMWWGLSLRFLGLMLLVYSISNNRNSTR